jgi:hypothetical protein
MLIVQLRISITPLLHMLDIDRYKSSTINEYACGHITGAIPTT